MCKSSVNAALEHFEEYETNKEEANYILLVARRHYIFRLA